MTWTKNASKIPEHLRSSVTGANTDEPTHLRVLATTHVEDPRDMPTGFPRTKIMFRVRLPEGMDQYDGEVMFTETEVWIGGERIPEDHIIRGWTVIGEVV
jgi:hypothetical protein